MSKEPRNATRSFPGVLLAVGISTVLLGLIATMIPLVNRALVYGPIPTVTRYLTLRTDGTVQEAHIELKQGDARWHRTTYDTDGTRVLSEEWLTADRKVLRQVDQVRGTLTTFRTDRNTPRRTQFLDGSEQETTFKKDGKVWWERNKHRGKVWFDWNGTKVNKTFLINQLSNGYTIKSTTPPIPVVEHVWLHDDGKPAYKQTWYAKSDGFAAFEGLGKVEIYAADGVTVTTRIELHLQPRRFGLFISRVEELKPDGGKFVRTYRYPDNRLSEETFDAGGKSLKKETFEKSDRYIESFDNFMFEGYGHVNIHGDRPEDELDI